MSGARGWDYASIAGKKSHLLNMYNVQSVLKKQRKHHGGAGRILKKRLDITNAETSEKKN